MVINKSFKVSKAALLTPLLNRPRVSNKARPAALFRHRRYISACAFHRPYAMNMSNDGLIANLVAEGVIKHQDVASVMRRCDRGAFCPKDLPKHYIYQDSPLPIGYGETISAPHMHATCLELLRKHLHDGARALDVGSGSGYLCAAMGLMISPSGKVIGIEKHPELTEFSIQRMRESFPDLLTSGLVDIRSGNVLGDALDDVEEAFDAIHVGAAAATLPDILVQKLKTGGRMVIPIGEQWGYQVLQVVDKDEMGNVKKHNVTGVRYVPLTKPRPGEK